MLKIYTHIFIHPIIIFIIIINCLSYGQEKKITAVRTNYPPKIDGILNDPVWSSALPISDFKQEEPIPGNDPTFKTVVRILYDDENLYVGIMCYDTEPDKIIARELKLDGKWSGDDNIAILFDTYNDNRTAYWFGTNPLGMRDDALLTSGFGFSGFNEEWHGIWDVRSAIVDSGWSTEIVFPFSTFKFSSNEEQIWGINFQRKIQRTGESVQWTAYEKDRNFFTVASAGDLIGLRGISRGKPIYLKPFFTTGIQKNPFEKKYVYKPGLDIKYGISQMLSLDVTFNTDFAQVESDKAQINLTRFPLFFPEKRDFFLEGRNVFNFTLGGSNNLFYSRRIGINKGEEVPIIAGAKLVGRLNDFELGVINMQTESKGNEPTTNYGLARGKFDLFDQSYAGFLISNKVSKNGFNTVYAADAVLTTSNFLGDKILSFGSGIAKSNEKNSSENSWAGKFYLDYPNDLINQYASYIFIQKNFNPAMGFISRNGIQSYIYNLKLTPRVEWGEISKLNFILIESSFDFDKNNILLTGNFAIQPFGFSTQKGDKVGLKIERKFDNVEESFEIFNSVFINRGKYWFTNYQLNIAAAPGRDVYGEILSEAGSFYNGNKKSIATNFVWIINKHLSLSADYEFNRILLDQSKFSTHEFGSRIRYDFSTMLYSSIFAQFNNQLNEINLNYRFNWQPNIGSNFYFVVNHLLSSADKLKSKEVTILTKIVWLFTL